ncbi:hypothetical protein [Enterocloster clostridioformis]|uniref:hypothetical protein n=1 Tax=Enterocloster clostridioformis TaxID=1531 RepID=UPI0008E35009|nr:hypothetical protein [Enterocloster clostridioformis]SFG86855.1 hypothetical protein SAMN05660211_04197 [Enterocloster clostridioformis]
MTTFEIAFCLVTAAIIGGVVCLLFRDYTDQKRRREKAARKARSRDRYTEIRNCQLEEEFEKIRLIVDIQTQDNAEAMEAMIRLTETAKQYEQIQP